MGFLADKLVVCINVWWKKVPIHSMSTNLKNFSFYISSSSKKKKKFINKEVKMISFILLLLCKTHLTYL